MKRTQKGFGVVEAILILVVVGLLAFVGWRLWEANQEDFLGTDSTSTSQTTSKEAPEINNASDLDKATKTLKDTDIDGGYEQKLNSELDF